jgi:hypothetical protein
MADLGEAEEVGFDRRPVELFVFVEEQHSRDIHPRRRR